MNYELKVCIILVFHDELRICKGFWWYRGRRDNLVNGLAHMYRYMMPNMVQRLNQLLLRLWTSLMKYIIEPLVKYSKGFT